MIPTLTATLVGDRQMVANVRAVWPALKREVDRETDRLTYKLQGVVQRDYLTGQVLKVQTGRLRGSITRGAPETRTRFESTPVAAFGYVGTNVKYGRIWELTGYAAHDVVAKGGALHFYAGGQELFRKRVHIPAQGPRPFLVPALRQMQNEIITSYRALAVRVPRETLKA
jgi:phage gpG-like protein